MVGDARSGGEAGPGAVASILAELRPQLPVALRRLDDRRLLALVNWSIIAAWEATIRRASQRVEAPRGKPRP